MNKLFVLVLVSIFLTGCLSQNIQPTTTHQQSYPETVPGQSTANNTDPIMSGIYPLIVKSAKNINNCDSPKVILARIKKYSPWDTSRSPPVLTGPIDERWSVDACGIQMEFIILIVPVKDGSGRFLINAASLKTVPKELIIPDLKQR